MYLISVNHDVIVVSRMVDHGKGLLYVSHVCTSLSYCCRIQSDGPRHGLVVFAVCILCLCIIDISLSYTE